MARLQRRTVAARRLGVVALTVALTGAGWWPLSVGTPDRAAAMGNEPARIAHSEVGANLRAAPGYDGEVLGILPDGSGVTLRIGEADTVLDPDGATRWWPVSTDQGDGWVAGFFVATDDGSAVDPAAEFPAPDGSGGDATAAGGATSSDAPAADSGGGNLWGPDAVISDTDGVNFRAQPGATGQSIRTLAYGTVVGLRIDSADTVWVDGSRWWPVAVDGLQGWVSGDYLAPDDGSVAAAPAGDSGQAPADDGSGTVDLAQNASGKTADAASYFAPGSYAAADTGGGNLNVRADGADDAEKVGKIPSEGVVQVMSGPTTDPTGSNWYQVTDGSVTGFVAAKFLAPAGAPADGLTKITAPGSFMGSPGVATGSLMYPLASYTLTQGYGCTPFWFEPWNSYAGCNFHNGIDLAAPYGSPIEAADGGTVEQAGWCDCGLGWYVKINHNDGFETVYGHMSEYYVTPGQEVAKGETIGAVGSSGNSTGPHVHFIVDVSGQNANPFSYLP